jgi:multidrug efflux pump subunit AcrA (membrane-fusion protein)
VILFPTGQNKENISWEGRVIRKQADLDEKGRLAQIIVSVSGPLDNPDQPLLLGMYVTAKIQGKSVPGVFSIPRSALRGSNEVWLVNSESRLEVHPIEVVWSGLNRVLVRDGLKEGGSLVISDLATPVEEMLLKVISSGGEDR